MKPFLLVVAPLLAITLALLGLKTLASNPLGWFLLLVGIIYTSGTILTFFIRKEHFWESGLNGAAVVEEKDNRSFWLIALGMSLAFYLSPIDYLYFPTCLPHSAWMSVAGMGMVVLGIILFTWARITLKESYSAHITVKSKQVLVQSGPYHLIRHPAYAGYLLMALGFSLGYSSLVGLLCWLVLLLPSILYRIGIEEEVLGEYFGPAYQQYSRTTKRLIPGIW